jgi:hypothetical protein
MFDRAQEIAQRSFAFTANQEFNLIRIRIGVGREAGIVPACHDAG